MLKNNNKGSRIKVASRNEGQEYAHVYPTDQKHEDYQYENEDKRVTYHVNSDVDDNKNSEQLYGVDPESTVEKASPKPTNKIRARMTADEVREENKERAYKVRNKPQIYDKTDLGQEAYELNHDPRVQEVQEIRETSQLVQDIINDENSRDMSNPLERFAIGTRVKHLEEGIKGEIKFVGSKKVAVVWEDETRERFSLAEANESLVIDHDKEYISDAQSQVDPLHTSPFPKSEDNLDNEVNDIYDKAIAALDLDEKDNIIESDSSKFDVEKAKLKRKVDKLEGDLNSSNIEKIKTKAAYELIDLMKTKSLINDNETQKYYKSIMTMDDNQFEKFQNQVVKGQVGTADVALIALNEDDDFSDIEDGQEFAKIKTEAKKSTAPQRTVDGIEMGDTSFFENGGLKGFTGNVGDFSNSSQSMSFDNQPSTRSVKRNDNTKTASTQSYESNMNSGKLDLSGFQNLEGLRKPINIASKEINAGSKFSDLFSSMQWTTVSKIH